MTMKNTFNLLNGIAVAVCLLSGTSAIAQSMSSTDFSASKTRIKTEYKSEKRGCAALAGNAKDICVEEAKGKESVALAELDNSYKPTLKTQYKVHTAKADAVYEVAKQKCDDLSGNPKDVCEKEAKAVHTSAKADAKVQMKTSQANAKASEKTAEAKAKASSDTAEVRSDAAADKRAAELKVAEEKCDALASTAKDKCLAEAKAKFGKL
jgi:multidrug efflux pump subunit AcrB